MIIRRRNVLTATALAVAFAASLVSAASAADPTPPSTPPDQGIVESWAVSPAAADATSGNRPNLTYAAAPGATLDDAITVYNYGNVTETFNLYGTDAFNNEQGNFDLLAADKKPVDAGSWVKLEQILVTVPPGKQVTMPIKITIPADATPGDHVGGILASSATNGASPDGKVIQLDRRTGTRLYIRVAGPLTPSLAVVDVKTDYHQGVSPFGGTAHVRFRLENRGNVRLEGIATVSIAGPFGIGEQKVTLPKLQELLPGQKYDLSADLKGLSSLFLDTTTVKVVPTSDSDVGSLTASSSDDTSFVPPITVLLVVLMVVVIIVLLRMRRRRRTALLPTVVAAPRRELERLSS